MLQLLSKLTGFDSDPEYFSSAGLYKEANRKFGGTYLIINDSLRYVKEFIEGEDYILADNTTISVQTIKAWMPEPGCYKYDENSYLYLYRKPRRQWLKSFCLGQNYDYIPIYGSKTQELTDTNIKNIYLDWKQNPDLNKDWKIIKNYIVYKFHVVGKLVGSTIVVLDNNFYQEIVDRWNKDFNITLAKEPQNHGVVENVNTPSW